MSTSLCQVLSCPVDTKVNDPVRSLSYLEVSKSFYHHNLPSYSALTFPCTGSQLCSSPTVPTLDITASVLCHALCYPRHPLSLIHISNFYSSFKTQIKSHFLSGCFPNHPTSGLFLLSYSLTVSKVTVTFGTATQRTHMDSFLCMSGRGEKVAIWNSLL